MLAIHGFEVYGNAVEVRRFKQGPDQARFEIWLANKICLVSLILRWKFYFWEAVATIWSCHSLCQLGAKFPYAIAIDVGNSIRQFLEEK